MMTLTIQHGQPADVTILTTILFTAFAADPLLLQKCYPDTQANRDWWTATMLDQIAHPTTQIVKVVDDESGAIVAFAKWSLHGSKLDKELEGHSGGAVQPSNRPSPDMNLDACERLAAAQFKMQKELMGERGHYCESQMDNVSFLSSYCDYVESDLPSKPCDFSPSVRRWTQPHRFGMHGTKVNC